MIFVFIMCTQKKNTHKKKIWFWYFL